MTAAPRRLALLAGLFAMALAGYFSLTPSNDRDGVAHHDRRFDLRPLEGVDVVSVYWTGPHIAPGFLSFAFTGGAHLGVSIEARKEEGEGPSTVNGFFRPHALHPVVADKRDVIGLRTNHRINHRINHRTNHRANPPEQVQVYRLDSRLPEGRRLLLAYTAHINAVAARPACCNSLTTPCTKTAG